MEGNERAGARRTTGIHRRRALGIFAVLAIGAAAVPALAGAIGSPDSPSPNRDINSYAIFGWDSVAIKGAKNAKVVGGNVGVNKAGGQLNICINGALTMGAGTQLVGDYLGISKQCTLHDVFYGKGHKPNGLAQIKHHGSAEFTAPLNPVNVPAAPTDARCDGTKSIVKGLGGNQTLQPGVYGNLTVKDGPSNKNRNLYKFTAGTYVFCDVNIGKSIWLDVTPTTKVIVTGTFSVSNDSVIGHGPGGEYPGAGDTASAQWFVRGDRAEIADRPTVRPCEWWAYDVYGGDCDSGAHVNFSKHTYIRSSFYARNGNLNLGNNTDLFGRYWARSISSDFGTRVTLPPGTPTPSTTTPTTTRVTTSTTRATTTTVRPTPTTIRSTTTLPET